MTEASEPLISFTIPGRAAGKKTSGNIIYPGVASMGLLKTPRMMAHADRSQQRRGPNARSGQTIMGIRDLLDYLAERIVENPQSAAKLCMLARDRVFPSIIPPTTHSKWLKRALPAMRELRCERPIVPEGHMVRVKCVVYLETGQSGDLINFEEALWDALEDAKIIPTDHWINSHDGSERRWTEPQNPHMDVALWDLGPKIEFTLPKVSVRGHDREAMGPTRFTIAAPDGKRIDGCSIRRGATRKRLVLEAMRLWGEHYDGDSLPEDSVIACGDASATVQGGLF